MPNKASTMGQEPVNACRTYGKLISNFCCCLYVCLGKEILYSENCNDDVFLVFYYSPSFNHTDFLFLSRL